MKPKLLLVLIILIVLNLQSLGQTPNFSGTWILNFEKSKLQEMPPNLTGQKFIIKQEAEKFALKIYHFYGDKTKKIGFRMIADGKIRHVKIIFKGKLEQM